MDIKIAGIIVGKESEVVYEEGTATKKISGKVKDVDDRGYLVLEDEKGKIILIPKDRVVTVKEK